MIDRQNSPRNKMAQIQCCRHCFNISKDDRFYTNKIAQNSTSSMRLSRQTGICLHLFSLNEQKIGLVQLIVMLGMLFQHFRVGEGLYHSLNSKSDFNQRVHNGRKCAVVLFYAIYKPRQFSFSFHAVVGKINV